MELLIKVMYLAGFTLLVFLQAMMINGAHESFKGREWKEQDGQIKYAGNILYPVARWLKAHVAEFWLNPLYGCVKCMASVYGGISFWTVVPMMCGFHWQEIPVFVFDVFILVYLNYYLNKQI